MRSIAADRSRVPFEILVVDGRSTDDTRSIVLRLREEIPELQLIDNPTGRIPTALNIGLATARADVIIRVDAHAVYVPGYVPESLRLIDELHADCVGWFYRTRPADDTYVAKTIADVWTSPFGVGNETSKTTVPGAVPREVGTVFGPCYRRTVFDRVGRFNERLTSSEDIELNTRLRRAGGRILLIPRFGCTYILKTTTLSAFLRKTLTNGFWTTYPIWIVGNYPLAPRHLVPLGFVVVLIADLIVAAFDRRALALDGAILVTYALVGVAFLSRIAPRRPDRALARLLVAFSFHVAYGLGSLHGVLAGTAEAIRSKLLPDPRQPT